VIEKATAISFCFIALSISVYRLFPFYI